MTPRSHLKTSRTRRGRPPPTNATGSPPSRSARQSGLSYPHSRRPEPERGTHAHTEFHRVLATATGNTVLRSLVETLGNALQGSREATVAIPGRIRRSTNEHRRIANAVRTGNPSAARAAMYAHVQRVIEEVRTIKGAPAHPTATLPSVAGTGRHA
ncbi:MAG: FCD domain-containing protein [Dehalococcoidia bacterium]|nr:FCD domain-containing protein [Dehalococcoidia bacterium]